MILMCKTCGQKAVVGGMPDDGIRVAWSRRSQLVDFCLSSLPRECQDKHQWVVAFLGKELAFFVLHAEHEVVSVDAIDNSEHPIDPGNLLTLAAAQPKDPNVPAVLALLEGLCERSIRGEIQGVVMAVQSGPSAYEMKWAGWNDPITAAGAMEAAKFMLLRSRTSAQAATHGGPKPAGKMDNVSVLRPEIRSANAFAVGQLLFTLRDRAASGQILGIVVALQTGADAYEMKWEGWSDPVVAAGAIDAAKYVLLRDKLPAQ